MKKNLYEPIVVLKNNHYFGIVTIKNLLDTIVSVEVQEKTLEITRKNKLLQNQQRIQERDMKMAELVQKSFYTSKAPCQNNWKSAFVFKPMASVSGDLYDFYFDADKNFVGAGLFDVSGHGVASGLIGILSKYLAEKIFTQNITKPLNKVIQLFSETLAKEKGSVENYLTGVFLRFKENFVEYVNACHTDVLYKNIKSGKTEVLGDKDGKFRGMFLGMEGLPSDGCSTVSLKVQTWEYGSFRDIDELFLMRSCRRHILSDSTFSRWGALLDEKGNTVYAVYTEDEKKIYPAGWVRVAYKENGD